MKDKLEKIWKDPVLSGVISTGIITAVSFSPAIFSSSYKEWLMNILGYQLPLYAYLIFCIYHW